MLTHDDYGDEQNWHDTAQICLNGHVVTSIAKSAPELKSKHCRHCGEPTITECPKCQGSIRGTYHVPGVIGDFEFTVPAFCSECGSAYPWTEKKLKAAKEFAEELEPLTPEEKIALKGSIDELVRATPQASVAASRFKKLLSKCGIESVETFKSLFRGVLNEAVKKMIWP